MILPGMKVAKGNMKLESMKREAKRGQAKKDEEIAMIHKTPSNLFWKPGDGSISRQIGMLFHLDRGSMLEEGLDLQPEALLV